MAQQKPTPTFDPTKPFEVFNPNAPFTLGDTTNGGRGGGAGPAGKTGANPLAGMEPQAGPGESSGWWNVASNFVKNFSEQLNPLPMLEILLMPGSPWKIGAMGQAMTEAHLQQLTKARDNYRKGNISEAVGHLMAGVIPLVGPPSGAIGEQIAQGDVSGGAGAMAGLITSIVAPGIATRINITPKLVNLAKSAEKAAVHGMASTMVPKTGPNKLQIGNMANEVAPDLLRDSTMGNVWSREALRRKVETRFQQAEQTLDAAHEARLKNRPINGPAVIQALEDTKARLIAQPMQGSSLTKAPDGPTTKRGPISVEGGVTGAMRTGTPSSTSVTFGNSMPMRSAPKPIGEAVVPGPTAARVAMIDSAIADIKALGDVVDFDALRKIRMAYDGPAKARYNPSITADFLKRTGESSGAADVTSVIRDVLSRQDKSVAAANSEYSLMRSAMTVLEAADEAALVRPSSRRVVGTAAAGGFAGLHFGGPGGAVAGTVLGPVLDAALTSGVTTQVGVSRMLLKFADAVKNRQANVAARTINQAAGTVGVTIEPGVTKTLVDTLKMPAGKAIRNAFEAVRNSNDTGAIGPLSRREFLKTAAAAPMAAKAALGGEAAATVDATAPTNFAARYPTQWKKAVSGWTDVFNKRADELGPMTPEEALKTKDAIGTSDFDLQVAEVERLGVPKNESRQLVSNAFSDESINPAIDRANNALRLTPDEWKKFNKKDDPTKPAKSTKPEGDYTLRVGKEYHPTGFRNYAEALGEYTNLLTRADETMLPLGTKVAIEKAGASKPIKQYTVGRDRSVSAQFQRAKTANAADSVSDMFQRTQMSGLSDEYPLLNGKPMGRRKKAAYDRMQDDNMVLRWFRKDE